MNLNKRPRWPCSWKGDNGEQCKNWAQSNGRRLCQQHFCQYDEQERLRAATELAGIINNDAAAPVCNIADNNDDDEQLNDGAPVENVGNHANNNDPHDVVDEQSDDAAAPVCNIADSIDVNKQQISAAPVDNGIINNDEAAPVRNIADNIDNNEQLNDAAPVENVGNHANNNDPHDVVDEQSNNTAAPVCNIADSMEDNKQLSDTAPVKKRQ
jgi:hypothetical protein